MGLGMFPGALTFDAEGTDVTTEFKIGMTGYVVDTLNPFLCTMSSEIMTVWPVYSKLLTYDVNGAVIGDLASSYTVMPDGVTYRLELVTNAFFIDPADPDYLGHPVTWRDVAWTYWEVNNEAANVLHGYFPSVIRDIWNEPGNEYVMYVQTFAPFAPMISGFCNVPILPEFVWSTVDPYRYANLPLIGSGPFYYGLTTMPTEYAQLERNPHWFQEANRGWHIQMSRLTLVGYPDLTSAYLDLTQGNIDLMAKVPGSLFLNDLVDHPNLVGLRSDEGFIYEFNLNQMTDELRDSLGGAFISGSNNQLLLDPVVKTAIAMCVDKQGLIDEALLGLGTPADSLVPGSNPWHYTYGSVPGEAAIPYDPDGARALLMANGWAYDVNGAPAGPATCPLCKIGGTDPLDFRFCAPGSTVEFSLLGQSIGEAAERAGVDLLSHFEIKSISEMNSIWYAADYDVWIWDWVMTPIGDPSTEIMMVLTTQAIGSSSDVFYSDPTYDSIYAQSLSETDPIARRLLTDELQRMAYEDKGCQCVAYRDALWAASTVEWTNYGDWSANALLSPAFGLPYLYMQVTPVFVDPNSPPTVDVPDLTVVLRRTANLFTVEASDPEGDTLTYTWDWGDGTTTVTDAPFATHEYRNKGTYTLTVYVNDSYLPGHTVSDSGTVVVMWPHIE